MGDFESILGTERASEFAQSLQELQTYYEARQQKLDTIYHQVEQERKEVGARLQTLRLLLGGLGQPVDLAAVSSTTQETPPTLALIESLGTLVSEIAPSSSSQPSAGKITDTAVSKNGAAEKNGATITTQEAPTEKRSRRKRTSPPAPEVTPEPPAPKGRSRKTKAQAEEAEAPSDNGKEGGFDSSSLRLKEFRDLPMLDAIATVMSRRSGEELHVDDIVNALYGKRLNKALYQKVKYITNKALSRGKQADRWRSVAGRLGYYVFPTESRVL